MNSTILSGRLTRDPDIRSTAGDKPMTIARYTLAVDRRVRKDANSQQQTADFISCVAFDRNAEFAEKYLKKGTKIVVRGRIQTGSYKNKDGQTVYTTDVVIEDQEFAESKTSSDGKAEKPAESAAAPVADDIPNFEDDFPFGDDLPYGG